MRSNFLLVGDKQRAYMAEQAYYRRQLPKALAPETKKKLSDSEFLALLNEDELAECSGYPDPSAPSDEEMAEIQAYRRD